MYTRVPDLSPAESAKIIKDVIGRKSTTQDYEQSEQALLRYNELLEKQKELDEEGTGKRAASDEVWAYAWAEKEEYYRLKNAPKESHTDPTPLLMDKASTLPPSAPERKQAEVVKGTIDNTVSGVGHGLDTITRESYKETKRLVKHSEMLHEGAKEPLPSSDQIVGEEEGQVVSNLQSWKPALANAVKPISDATGSHSDTRSSVAKGPTGSDQFMPAAATAIVDNISPHFTNQIDASFKAVQMDSLQNSPAKSAGSIRNLTTAADPSLSVPFEIASDVYGGLLGVMDEVSNLGDVVMAGMTQFNLSPLGGLQNNVFPANQLTQLLGPVKNITNLVDGLSQMLGGFDAIANITDAIGGIASKFSSILNDASKLASMMSPGANVGSIVGGMAGKSIGCAGDQLGMSKVLDKVEKITAAAQAIAEVATVATGVLGSLDNVGKGLGSVGKGLGNLGAILGGGINLNIGKLTLNLRMPEQIIAGILPPELNNVLQGIDKLPGLGMAGNGGFSVGKCMDHLADDAFSKSMSNLASHAAILGPVFNKQTKPTGSYAQDSSLNFFAESQFVKGAQGNKGVTMLGPGSTASQKVFGKL